MQGRLDAPELGQPEVAALADDLAPRSWWPLTRIASLARSPMAELSSVAALTYVPMPPFHSRSTGACRIAFISSAGVMVDVPLGRPRASTISRVMGTDFSDRSNTPPPALMRSVS